MNIGLKIFLGTLAFIAVLMVLSASCTRIDAGHVGIKVNLYGDDKGVQDITEVTGMVWYNPITTKIYEFPTFIQHKVFTADYSEDSPKNEEFTVTTKDGLSLSFDVGLDYMVKPDMVPAIFKKYRKELQQISNEFIRTLIRNAYNNTASTFTAEDIVSRRAEYEDLVRKEILEDMDKAGFIVSQVSIIGKIRLPATLEDAINAKIRAVQEAIKAENEKQRVIAEAQKMIEEAKGYAQAKKIRADADAYEYATKQRALTPLIIQQQFVEKWDGKLPVYGEVPKLFKGISN